MIIKEINISLQDIEYFKGAEIVNSDYLNQPLLSLGYNDLISYIISTTDCANLYNKNEINELFGFYRNNKKFKSALHLFDDFGQSISAVNIENTSIVYSTDKISNKDDAKIIVSNNVSHLNIVDTITNALIPKKEQGYDLIVFQNNLLNQRMGIEENFIPAFLSQILCSINHNSYGGSSIIRINCLYHKYTAKCLQLAAQFYNKISLIKPESSGFKSVDRYIVLDDFKYEHKNKIIESTYIQINAILEKIAGIDVNKFKIIDIFNLIEIENVCKPILEFNNELIKHITISF